MPDYIIEQLGHTKGKGEKEDSSDVTYGIGLAIAFIIVYFLVPLVRAGALRWRFVDVPNTRKIHEQPMPLMGGLAIFVGFLIAMFTVLGIQHRVVVSITIGGFMLIIVGLWDDWYKSRAKDLPAWPKFAAQLLASFIPIILSIRMVGISNPFRAGEMIIFPYFVSVAATLLWIVAIINMINFLDGVDGLASGISTISGITLFLMAFFRGQDSLAMLSIILVGACVGFLKHNFHPAKIFMGDAGSMFIGFALAVISLEGALKVITLLSLLVTVLALAVPIFDTMYVMLLRLVKRKPLHMPDRSHAHHRLLNRGLNQKQTVFVLYLFGIGFSLISLMMLWLYF